MVRGRFATTIFACLIGCGVANRDLPRRRAEEPRKTDTACAYLGQGYTRAPGSDTCVKLGGSLRFEGQASWSR